MKRIFVFLLLTSFLFVGCSSDPSISAAFSKYSGCDGVSSITIPGFAIRTVTMFADLSPQEEKLLKKVELLKVLAVDDAKKYDQVNFSKEFSSRLDSNYQQLLSIKEGKNNINIMAKMVGDENISDLLIVIGGDDNAMIYLKGNFNVNEIAEAARGLKTNNWKNMVSM